MISRHHYPQPTDDLARLAAQLDAEDARDAANGVDVWDRVFPPVAPGVCDCDEPAIRDSRGNAVDIGEPWPRGWLGRAVVNVLFFAAWLLGGALAGLFAAWAGGAL